MLSGHYLFTRASTVPLSSSSTNRIVHNREALAIVLDAPSSMRRIVRNHQQSNVASSSSTTATSSHYSGSFYCKSNEPSFLKLATDLISDLIVSHIQDKTDKNVDCIIVVVGTEDTFHHLHITGQNELDKNGDTNIVDDDDIGPIPFPHITEVNGFVEAGRSMSGSGTGDDDQINKNIETKNMNMMRPSLDMLRQLHKVLVPIHDDCKKQTSSREKEIEANFCDGLILAADSIHRHMVSSTLSSSSSSSSNTTDNKQQHPARSRTTKHNNSAHEFTKRRVLIITDASSPIHYLDSQQLQVVIEGLQRLQCCVDVVGLDFHPEWNVDFSNIDEPTSGAEAGPPQTDDANQTNDHDENNNLETNDASSCGTEVDDNEESSDGDEESNSEIDYKGENVKLLRSIAELTKGSIMDFETFRNNQFDKTHIVNEGKRITLRKMVLHIAPKLSIFARFSLLQSEVKMPRLKKKAIMFDEDGSNKPLTNALGEEILSDIQTITEHYDEVSNDAKVVPMSERTTAYRYGKDLIPMGKIDMEGLRYRPPDPSIGGNITGSTLPPIQMSILGFRPVDELPLHLCLGPSYFVVPGSTVNEYPSRARAAIANLAKAMENLKRYALCSFIKSKDADSIIGFLMPLPLGCNKKLEGDNVTVPSNDKYALCFTQMPFADEVLPISLPSLQQRRIPNQREEDDGILACHEMIDACTIRPPMTASSKVESEKEHCKQAPTLVQNPCLISVRRSRMKRLVDRRRYSTYIEPAYPSDPFSLVKEEVSMNTDASLALKSGEEGGINEQNAGGQIAQVTTDAMVVGKTTENELRKEKIENFQKHFPISRKGQGIEAGGGGDSRKRKKPYLSDPVDYSKY